MTPEIADPPPGLDKKNQKLKGGWLPAEWLGTGRMPRARPQRKFDLNPGYQDPALATPDKIDYFRLKAAQVRAVVRYNLTSDFGGSIPFTLFDAKLAGEEYFLVLCQQMYREMRSMQASNVPLQGEDVVYSMLRLWSEGRLARGYVLGAMEETALKGDDDDDD